MSGGPRVKICGLRRAADVRAAAAAGADYLGFVLATGPRHVEPARARELHEPVTAAPEGSAADPPPRAVAVLVDASVDDARAAAAAAGAGILQLHGQESPEACRALREAGLEVWKALRPRSEGELRELVARYRAVVDVLHVEGWSARAAGGTGTGFPWAWTAALREEGATAPPRRGTGPHPDASTGGTTGPALVLAGGLTPDNVAEAIRRVRPFAVDVSSGVELRPGVKDAAKVRAFVEGARGAVAAGPGGPERG